jgi:hypothetical protein
MQTTRNLGQPTFTLLDIDVTDIHRHPTALLDMILTRRIDGITIRNVFSRATAAAVVERLEQFEQGGARPDAPAICDAPDVPILVGQPIASTSDLDRYFEQAAMLRGFCAELFCGHLDYEGRIAEVLGALSEGRPAVVPTGPSTGSAYAPSTIRLLPEGREIGVHVGNEFLRIPHAKHLLGLLEATDQLSFFVTLATPETGGELCVYELEWDHAAPFIPAITGPGRAYLSGSPVFELAEEYGKVMVRPNPGDMFLFNGGRYYHRVSRVGGKTSRWTIGGFAGLSRDHGVVHYWS